MIYLLALLIGVVAGLRAVTPLAAVSWAAALGWIDLSNSWASFMGSAITPWIFTILAVVELVTDQLPQTPSRKVPMQFGARIVTGAFAGAVLVISGDALIGGLIAGAIGAILGTLGGAELRARMAAAFGSDRPAGLAEDVIAIVLAFAIVALV
ncbi:MULTISPECIES: DUF4126 family protein [unclassified Devosia]|uniref:DUF4126 family protein n=1 Tax=unclassified Devosia TaxID=196773 RepID=UPI0015551303|nr:MULTISPECIES: DUF4126 family protein [unclassified Devosia]